MVTNTLCIIGNIMYTLYYSPYIVLFGKLVAATGAARLVALAVLNIIHAILNYFTLCNVSQGYTIKKSVNETFSSKEHEGLLEND